MDRRKSHRKDNKKKSIEIKYVRPIPEDRVTQAISQALARRMVERSM